MGRKKVVKELTEEEILQQEKESAFYNIKDRIRFINPPTYEFNIGDKVILGDLKDVTIDYVSKDKKIYGLIVTSINSHNGNTKSYRFAAWHELKPLSIVKNISDLTINKDIFINFQNTTIE